MEQMTDVNLMQSANWKHLQGGKGSLLAGKGCKMLPKVHRVGGCSRNLQTGKGAVRRSFWEKESQCSLRAWPLEGQPHTPMDGHTPVNIQIAD